MVQAIPQGYHSVTCYLIVPNSVEAMALYRQAFGAEEVMRMPGPDGQSTMHAEIRVGDSFIMLSDENPQWDSKSPKTLGGSPVGLHLYVEDADAVYQQALKAGCAEVMPPQNMFWGDRYGKVRDPYGHLWSIATHQEDVSPEEMERRAAEMFCASAEQ